MYLFDEYPIIANKTLAREIGLNEALILQQINYWIEINKKTGKNFYDGRYWTYNSIRSWRENDFDYMSIETVKRTFAKLEKQGYLITGNFNKDPRDKTKWYTIDYERLSQLYQKIENKKKEIEDRALFENVNYVDKVDMTTNALGQNDPMEKIKKTKCKESNCTNALMQNDLMQDINLNQPLPNITTKNNTKNNSYISTNPSIIPSYSQNKTINNEQKFCFLEKTEGMKDGIEKENKNYQEYLEEFRETTGYYAHLEVGNNFQAEEIDEILKIICDVMILDDNEIITINQNKIRALFVKERYMQLKYEHLEYLVNTLKYTQNKILNIRAFVLTAAYNVVTNMDAHYTALINYDSKYWY